MAIEIRQLVIRAVVDGGARPQSVGSDRRAATLAGHVPSATQQEALGKAEPVATPIEFDANERQAIINACVREVLRKLERARER